MTLPGHGGGIKRRDVVEIWLREQMELCDDSDVLIHLGTGDPARLDSVLDRCITGYQGGATAASYPIARVVESSPFPPSGQSAESARRTSPAL